MHTNYELLHDRALFTNLYKHNHISQLNCQPHYPHPYTSSTTSNVNGYGNQRDVGVMVDFVMRMMGNLERVFVGRMEQLEERVCDMNMYVNRMHAVIKFKRSSRLYSFANSPNSKNNNKNDHDDADIDDPKPKHPQHKRHNIPASASKYNSTPKHDQYLKSTQPRTRQKQQPYSLSPEHKYKDEYFDSNMENLHREILELRQFIQKAHHDVELGEGEQGEQQEIEGRERWRGKIGEFGGWGWEEVKKEENKDRGELVNTVERYRAITVQYQKQEDLLRQKIQKYRKSLYNILGWLKTLKQSQLPSYLPCHTCHLKTIITQYLQPQPQPQPQSIAVSINLPQNPPSNPLKSQINKNYEELYEELEQMRPVSQFNQNLSDQDQLLMEYDEGDDEDDGQEGDEGGEGEGNSGEED